MKNYTRLPAGRQGFTLIEMLVSVAIFTIVMVIALGALLSLSEADRKAQTINAAVNNLSFAIDSMSRLMRTGINYHCGSDTSTRALTESQNCINAFSSPPGPQPQMAFQVVDDSLSGCTKGSACTVVYCLSVEGSTNSCNSAVSCAAGSSCSILRAICAGASCTSYTPITSPEVSISSLSFYVTGSALGDTIEPKATILVSGTVPVTATKSTAFNLQTSVTARLYGQ